MRMIVKSSLLAVAITAAAAVVQAQAPVAPTDPTQAQHRPHPGGMRHGPNPEFETKMLTKRLGLSPEQASQAGPILTAQSEQMKALRPAPGTQPDPKAMHDQREAIMTETKQKLSAVLTPEQQQQFASMHGGSGDHRGRGHRPPGGTPPAPAD